MTWATVSAGVGRSTLTVTRVTVSGKCRGWKEYTHGDVGDRKFCEERCGVGCELRAPGELSDRVSVSCLIE
jgi:hypothetical protein